MKDIYIYSNLFYTQMFFHLQSCDLVYLFQIMVIEMLFNHKIQIFFKKIMFSLKNLYNCIHY